MYAYIKGMLRSKNSDRIVIENSGIGYEMIIGAMTYNNLPNPPEEVMLYTYHYIREDKEELYGFSSTGEKRLFEILVGVSSIGPGKAVSILSQVSPAQFIDAVKKKDLLAVSSVKGIGKKTAERMILELKDKLGEITLDETVGIADRTKIEDAMSGLVSLGFKENEARELIYSIKDDLTDSDRAQDIIKKALKHV
ncbi:Holliday junction branch migration protein RuvA [Elusimicrobiota bacterium]